MFDPTVIYNKWCYDKFDRIMETKIQRDAKVFIYWIEKVKHHPLSDMEVAQLKSVASGGDVMKFVVCVDIFDVLDKYKPPEYYVVEATTEEEAVEIGYTEYGEFANQIWAYRTLDSVPANGILCEVFEAPLVFEE